MYVTQNWKPLLAVTSGTLVVLFACLSQGLPHTVATWSAFIGALLAQSSIFFYRHTGVNNRDSDSDLIELAQQRSDFEAWQMARAEELQQQSQRLNERHRSLAEQSAKFQEFIEYPNNQPPLLGDIDEEVRLSELDRSVHELLEKEAELVYERIRRNEYTVNGSFNVDKVRDDVLNLVRKVAHIYTPHSTNPLLETSFEQLARAASRICLHTLVLLEQLPLDVKSYKINDMYSYVRKAVQGYGAYKQAAPWIKHLSRGAYFGRFAAGANPVTLGAWWLATELGRRGAQKVVENVVDRQTVAVLHDIVTVVGVEAANIYGPGFRQRDPAWVYGTELTELLARFPMSRESLSRGLQQITQLPLKSEYDRIYLYRCLANQKTAGMRLIDPSILTRMDRESIAAKLETFFRSYIHGVKEQDRVAWQEDIESRFDLKMKLGTHQNESSVDIQAQAAAHAVFLFLTSVAAVPADKAKTILEHSTILHQIPLQRRAVLMKSLDALQTTVRFEPPNLDPDAELTQSFLACLFESCIQSKHDTPDIVNLLLETTSYFRRSPQDGQLLLDLAYSKCLDQRKTSDCRIGTVTSATAQQILHQLNDNESLSGGFKQVGQLTGEEIIELPNRVLITIVDGIAQKPDTILSKDQTRVRALLLNRGETSPEWTSLPDITVKRRKGYLIDDCEIYGGEWTDARNVTCIVLAGSLTAGGFRKTFAPILAAFSNPHE